MLKINGLSKTIGKKQILKNLDFEIDHGQIAIFLGGSGVGKSTLLRVLNNLESYDTGSFSLDGFPLNLATANSEHSIGMVFQHFNLFEHLNAEENIILTLLHCKRLDKESAQNIASNLLKRYSLQDHAKTNVGRLSGGQKQRLAIARTLCVDPKIVCLDEPTSALDPKLTGEVAKFITELAAEERIVLLTTHDMHLLKYLSGQLFLMEKGSIVETASQQAYNCNVVSYPKLHDFLKGDE